MLYQRIRYFLKASEARSLSKAAEQMYLSPQALTKQINALEEELGGKLFIRSPQGISLTPFGQYACEQLKKIDSELADVLRRLKSWNHDGKERIRIGIFSALPQESLVTPIVTFLLGSFPEYQIVLNMLPLDEGLGLLRNGDLDILLTNVHEEEDLSHYRCLSLARAEAEVVVSLLHPWAVRESLTLEDLKKETLLKLFRDSRRYTVPLPESFYENIPCRDIQWVENFDTMYTLLQQGNAFAVIPKAFRGMDNSRLKYFDFPDRRFIFHTVAICNAQNPFTGAEKVIRELKDEFNLEEL